MKFILFFSNFKILMGYYSNFVILLLSALRMAPSEKVIFKNHLRKNILVNITKTCPCSKGESSSESYMLPKYHQHSTPQQRHIIKLHCMQWFFPFIIRSSHIAFTRSTILHDVSHLVIHPTGFVLELSIRNCFLFLKGVVFLAGTLNVIHYGAFFFFLSCKGVRANFMLKSINLSLYNLFQLLWLSFLLYLPCFRFDFPFVSTCYVYICHKHHFQKSRL